MLTLWVALCLAAPPDEVPEPAPSETVPVDPDSDADSDSDADTPSETDGATTVVVDAGGEGEPAGTTDDDGVYEIVVYADVAAEFARQEVIERLDEAGYTDEIERDGYVVRRHADNWRGEVHVFDDGYIQVKRQPVQLEPPFGDRGTPLGTASCVVLFPFCTKFGGQTVGRRKLQAQKTAVVQFLDPDLDEWSDRIADREVGSRIQILPDQLEALWFEGTPLEGDDVLATIPERKAAILAYWDSRTDTVWGDRVRLTVEGFLRAVVQPGDTPFTDAEIADFNSSRSSTRALDLTSSWDAVSEGLTLQP